MNDHIYIDEYEIQELRDQDKAARRYQSRLALNPDCRDPDHPGCVDCKENDDEC